MAITNDAQALLFDVFGTCVNWRKSVTDALWDACRFALSNPAASMATMIRIKAGEMTYEDWGAFAQDWRTTYYKFTRDLASGNLKEWKTVDQHNSDSLRELLAEHGLIRDMDETGGLFLEEEIRNLSKAWHNLESWPDTNRGSEALGTKYATCTLSNGNISLLKDMQAFSGMKFTHTFSSESFNSYKPNPAIYHGAAEKLNLKENQCVMVAAHLGDSKAAKACGYQTIYVERPLEESYDVEEAKNEGFVDLWITEQENGFITVAQKLGIEV